MDIEERVEIAILTKYYAKMLTEKQRSVLSMYVDNNLSFAEVSEELNISRQAVKDALDTAILTLKDMEEKLNFIKRDEKLKAIIQSAPLGELSMKTRLEILAILEDD